MKNLRNILIALTCLVSSTAFASMDVAEYERLAGTNVSRCTDPISTAECKVELDYGLAQGLITQRSYDWGVANGYYPVIDRNDNVRAICKCGCFEADTNISVWSKEAQKVVDIAAKDINAQHQLVALSADATLSAMTTGDFAIKTLTQGPEKPALFVFDLEDGTQLKVTQHHGMLLSSGEMVAAKDVNLKQSFISADSQSPVKIVNISREFTDKDVFNFETESDDVASHIIVAEGVYVGDLIWQNQLAKDLGAIAVRK
ncbi:hypothetical protein [Thalassomonas haliotis]|uniref:Hint domain-containing protein n=1 Tax=Thalassomonas haliotis TaxID=485448 RepID=A0ABY7VB42_9GAMM|nr:hypothetical protein [Thalassomonas haliotis]WDE10556.1 hypothetical protein H3N35_20160 [Thalassomonas haliotis]